MAKSKADQERDEREHADRMAALKRDNDARLRDWRKTKLQRAGFSSAQAELLLDWGVEVWKAIDLADAGCKPDLAVDIMRPDFLPPSYEADEGASLLAEAVA